MKPPPPPPPSPDRPAAPGSRRASAGIGKSGRPAVVAREWANAPPSHASPRPFGIERDGRDGTGLAVGCISSESGGKGSFGKTGWDGPDLTRPVGANGYLATKKPAVSPPPPRPAPPDQPSLPCVASSISPQKSVPCPPSHPIPEASSSPAGPPSGGCRAPCVAPRRPPQPQPRGWSLPGPSLP